MRVAVLDLLSDRFTVGYLRRSYIQLDAVSTLQDVDFNIKVQLAHSLENGFAGIFVSLNLKGRIFRDHFTNRDTHFLDAALVFRSYGNRNNRIREYHGFQRARMIRAAKRMACLHVVLHANNGEDVASLRALKLVTIIGMHLYHATNPLGLAGKRVQNGIAFVDLA